MNIATHTYMRGFTSGAVMSASVPWLGDNAGHETSPANIPMTANAMTARATPPPIVAEIFATSRRPLARSTAATIIPATSATNANTSAAVDGVDAHVFNAMCLLMTS